MHTIEVSPQFNEEEADAIYRGIGIYNTPYFGNIKTVPVLITLKKETLVEGGLIGWMRPGMHLLFIDMVWVQDDLRRNGYGSKLMLKAEEVGKHHNCTHSQLETLSFQARGFYEKLGYKEIGIVEKWYGEHDAFYMRKSLK